MYQFLFLSLLVVSRAALAGEFEFWNSTSVEQKINESYSTYGEFIYRHSDESQNLKVLSTRLGIIRAFDDKWKGSVILETRTTDSAGSNESRSIFQVSRKFDFDSVKVSARARWELRKFSDSEVVMNRFRLFARADLLNFTAFSWTPYIAAEQFFITNTVGSRPAGSTEFRNQFGVSTDGLGGVIELAYLFREQKAPSLGAISSKYSMYHIFNTSLKFTF